MKQRETGKLLHNFYIIHRLKYSVSRLDQIHTRLMEIAKEERDLLNKQNSISSHMFKSKMNLHINEIIDGIGHG